MSNQVPKETFGSPEHQAWLKIRKEQDPLNPQPIHFLAGRPLTIGVEGTVHVPARAGFYLAYKAGSCRAPAKPTRWETREQAQLALDDMGKHVSPPSDFNDFLHVIEVEELDESIGV